MQYRILGRTGPKVSEIVVGGADLCPVPIVRVGLQDTYPESGEAEALLDQYRMGVRDIAAAMREAARRK